MASQKQEPEHSTSIAGSAGIYTTADSRRAPILNLMNLHYSSLARGGPAGGHNGQGSTTTTSTTAIQSHHHHGPCHARTGSSSSDRPEMIRGQEGDEEVLTEVGDLGWHHPRDIRRASSPDDGCQCHCNCPGCFCRPWMPKGQPHHLRYATPAEHPDDSPPESLMVEHGTSPPLFFSSLRSHSSPDMSGVLLGVEGAGPVNAEGDHSGAQREHGGADVRMEYAQELSGSDLDF